MCQKEKKKRFALSLGQLITVQVKQILPVTDFQAGMLKIVRHFQDITECVVSVLWGLKSQDWESDAQKYSVLAHNFN